MSCAGKCTITKTKTRRVKLLASQALDKDCPALNKTKSTKVMNDYIAKLETDIHKGCEETPCDCGEKKKGVKPNKTEPECECVEIPGQKPKPTPWKFYKKKIKHKVVFPRRTCNYLVTIQLELQRTVFEGNCHDIELPDFGVLFTEEQGYSIADEPIEFSAEELLAMEEPTYFDEELIAAKLKRAKTKR